MQRLKVRAQFQAVLSKPPIAKSAHFALHQIHSEQSLEQKTQEQLPEEKNEISLLFLPEKKVWIGAVTPKRWAKRAATRNAIKRQIYELARSFALFSDSANTKYQYRAIVVRLRSSFIKQEYKSASSEKLKSQIKKELLEIYKTAGAAICDNK